MEALVVFRSNDTGYNESHVTLTCKTVANPSVAVDTTGFTFYHLMTGIYLLTIPLATEESLFSIYVTSVPTTKFEGTLESGISEMVIQDLTVAIGNLVAQSLITGTVSNPYQVPTEGSLVLYTNTDQDNISFTVGPQWSAYLVDPDAQVWFTAKLNPRSASLIDVAAVIDDPASGAIKVSLTRTQTNIEAGTFYWQLQLRKPIYTGNPPVLQTTQKRILMEGRLYVKPSFKA